jgi:uncharacterized protein YbaR (Trm112 family)
VGKVATLRRAVSELTAVRANAQRFSPHPPSDGLVVEIGGGQSPYSRADVVIDKYVADDFERPGASAISFERPLVVGDGECIPIRDKAAAYSIASHVLEHASDPVAFAAELSRISAAGYVEVPSRQAELTFGWPFHPWLIDCDSQMLVFYPRRELTAPVGDDHHRLFHGSVLYALMHQAHRHVWHHAIEWSDSLQVRVEGVSVAPQAAVFDLDATITTLERAATAQFDDVLIQYLACPVCTGHVTTQGHSTITCFDCDRRYPFINQVPILVREAAN